MMNKEKPIDLLIWIIGTALILFVIQTLVNPNWFFSIATGLYAAIILLPRFIAQKTGKPDFIFNLRLTLITAVLVYLAFPFFTPFIWVAFIPTFYLLARVKNWKELLFHAFLQSTIIMMMGYNYLMFTMSHFGHLHILWAWFGLFVFSMVFNSKMVIIYLLYYYLKRRIRIPIVVIYPVVWTMVEFLFPEFFPWYLGGFLFNHTLLIQFAEWTGVSGYSFVVIAINVALYELMLYLIKPKSEAPSKFPVFSTSFSAVLIVFLLLYGLVRIDQVRELEQQSEGLRVGMVQPNVPMHATFVERNEVENLLKCEMLSRKAYEELEKDMDLLIWSESAVSFLYFGFPRPSIDEDGQLRIDFIRRREDELIYTRVTNLAKELETHLMVSGVTYDCEGKYFNSVIGINPQGRYIDTYSKNIMVPLGEYQPFPWFMDTIEYVFPEVAHSTSNFTPSTRITTFETDVGITLAPEICYETIFPGYARRAILKGGEVIVETTNLIWFADDEVCARQHTALALFRCVENRVPICKCTNTGISTFISATGEQYEAETEKNVAAALTGTVYPIHDSPTFFTMFGNVFALLMTIISIVFIFLGIKSKKGLPK